MSPSDFPRPHHELVPERIPFAGDTDVQTYFASSTDRHPFPEQAIDDAHDQEHPPIGTVAAPADTFQSPGTSRPASRPDPEAVRDTDDAQAVATTQPSVESPTYDYVDYAAAQGNDASVTSNIPRHEQDDVLTSDTKRETNGADTVHATVAADSTPVRTGSLALREAVDVHAEEVTTGVEEREESLNGHDADQYAVAVAERDRSHVQHAEVRDPHAFQDVPEARHRRPPDDEADANVDRAGDSEDEPARAVDEPTAGDAARGGGKKPPDPPDEPPKDGEGDSVPDDEGDGEKDAGSSDVGKMVPEKDRPVEDDTEREGDIGDRVDMAELNELVRKGKVYTNPHPTLPLRIANYTGTRLRESEWTPLLSQCRGLIVDNEGKIVARPFPRMHDVKSVEDLPPGEFEVTDKLDGSLGIQYWEGDEPRIATRQRFEGPQITQANQMLAEYQDYPFDKNNTYLWEIIYPENPHVVDYGEQRSLTLLGIIETATGQELPLPDQSEVPFPVVQYREGYANAAQLLAAEGQNAEGYVVRMKDTGERYKVKFQSYLWRDRQRRGTIPQRVWRQLSGGEPAEELIAGTPEFARSEVADVSADLLARYREAESLVRSSLDDDSIKLTIVQQNIRGLMRKGGDYSHLIWKIVRPPKTDAP